MFSWKSVGLLWDGYVVKLVMEAAYSLGRWPSSFMNLDFM